MITNPASNNHNIITTTVIAFIRGGRIFNSSFTAGFGVCDIDKPKGVFVIVGVAVFAGNIRVMTGNGASVDVDVAERVSSGVINGVGVPRLDTDVGVVEDIAVFVAVSKIKECRGEAFTVNSK